MIRARNKSGKYLFLAAIISTFPIAPLLPVNADSELDAVDEAVIEPILRMVDKQANPPMSKPDIEIPTTPKNEEIAMADQEAINTDTDGPLINFNNVNINEFLRFVGRLTGRNFFFDPQELDFPVTIMSETPATIDDVMAALLQTIRIHGFAMIEEGNNLIIHKSSDTKAPAELIKKEHFPRGEIATRVLHVSNIDVEKVASVLQTMKSTDAIIEVIKDNSSIVISDITSNISRMMDLTKQVDHPNSGLEIAQYVVINSSPYNLVSIAQKIIAPIVVNKPLTFVPYPAANSIYIVSSPFIVEKALSVLQSLDLNQEVSGILDIENMNFDKARAEKEILRLQQERAKRDLPKPITSVDIEALTHEDIEKILREKGLSKSDIDKMSAEIRRKKIFDEGLTTLQQQKYLGKKDLFRTDLPLGEAESTEFYIQKLQFRTSRKVADALQSIADALSSGTRRGPNASVQSDLVTSLLSAQAVEENNSIVFTGTRTTIEKIKDLISQIDIPVRQVFIEALVLDMNIDDSLTLGVEWAGGIRSQNYAAQMGLISDPTTSALNQTFSAITMPNTTPTNPITTFTPISLQQGFSASSIGRKVKFRGLGFRSTAALITALRNDSDTEIVLNPRITVEHNVPAEIFVGQEVPIKGQTTVLNAGTSQPTTTTNYETKKTGVSLKVTPLIGSNDMVTLIIDQTISSASAAQIQSQANATTPPATINETRTTTRVHMPSDSFLIMSGLVSDQTTNTNAQVPCLGAVPLIGFFFTQKEITDTKRNLVMLIRPRIIDTPIDIERITQQQDAVYRQTRTSNDDFRTALSDTAELLNLNGILGG